jgi:hypothetical protein
MATLKHDGKLRDGSECAFQVPADIVVSSVLEFSNLIALCYVWLLASFVLVLSFCFSFYLLN